jgi:hypothetical protein
MASSPSRALPSSPRRSSACRSRSRPALRARLPRASGAISPTGRPARPSCDRKYVRSRNRLVSRTVPENMFRASQSRFNIGVRPDSAAPTAPGGDHLLELAPVHPSSRQPSPGWRMSRRWTPRRRRIPGADRGHGFWPVHPWRQ